MSCNAASSSPTSNIGRGAGGDDSWKIDSVEGEDCFYPVQRNDEDAVEMDGEALSGTSFRGGRGDDSIEVGEDVDLPLRM